MGTRKMSFPLRSLTSNIHSSIQNLKNNILQQYNNSKTRTNLTSTSLFISLFQQQHQTRYFSKYLSKSAKKRLPLNTKWAGKGYVKGKRCTKEGYKTSKGRFVLLPHKRLELIVPNIDGFKLK